MGKKKKKKLERILGLFYFIFPFQIYFLFERQQHSLWPRSMTLIFLGWQSQSHHSGRRLSAADTCFNHSWTRDASPPFPHLTPTSIIRHISLFCFFFLFFWLWLVVFFQLILMNPLETVWNCVGGDDSSSGPPLMLRSIEIISMSHHLWSVVNAERNGGMARSRVQQSNRIQQHQFVDHLAAGQSAGQSSLQGKASSPTKKTKSE